MDTGEFNGYAWSANIGWIKFSDSKYKVRTNIIEKPPLVKETPIANLKITPIEGQALLTVSLDASSSYDSDGTIEEYTWIASNDQEKSGTDTKMTFNNPGNYDVILTVTDNDGLTDTVQETIVVKDIEQSFANLKFIGLKDFYRIGETVEIELFETVERDKYTRIDLWMAIELPNGNLIFRTNIPFVPWSPNQQPYKTSIENTDTSHHIFDFELPEGLGGDYTLYAVYVKEGENPVTNGFSIRSNLVIKQIFLANRKD